MVASTRYYLKLGRIVALLMLLAFTTGLGLGALMMRFLQPPGGGGGRELVRQAAHTQAASLRPALRPAIAEPAPISEALRPVAMVATADEVDADTDAVEPEPALAAIGPELRDADAAETTPEAPQAEEVVVKPGDTLMDILMRAGVASAEAHDAVASLGDVYDPRKLQAGQTLALELDSEDGADQQVRLASLSLDLDLQNGIRVARNDDGAFAATTVLRELKSRQLGVEGEIETSLYADGIKAGIPGEMLAAMVKLFSWDVDFERDIQPGNSFAAVYEHRSTEDGRDAGTGDLLFASLGLGDRTVSAYRFERPDGSVGWYDKDGHSMRKSLLRTPIDGARLSSRFGLRHHPVLGYSRMHKGVDFAAPTGTPIFAAGDGQIETIGVMRGFGRYIRIHHNSEYSTAYGHMSRFAKGLTRGSRVHQGDVIGYVGATGLATGPHLHYEILKDGTQINPLSAKQTFADSLSGADLVRFRRTVAEIDKLRDRMPGNRLVAQTGDAATSAAH